MNERYEKEQPVMVRFPNNPKRWVHGIFMEYYCSHWTGGALVRSRRHKNSKGVWREMRDIMSEEHYAAVLMTR